MKVTGLQRGEVTVRIMAFVVTRVFEETVVFTSGYEWERAKTADIENKLKVVEGFRNPPTKPIMLCLTRDLKVQQCSIQFENSGVGGEVEHELPLAGAYTNPWAVRINGQQGWFGGIDINQAVERAQVIHCRITAHYRSNPELLDAAWKRAGSKKKPKPIKEQLQILYKKHNMAELQSMLEERGMDTGGLKVDMIERLIESHRLS